MVYKQSSKWCHLNDVTTKWFRNGSCLHKYFIQHYVIKFVSEFSNKTDCLNITELLLKVVLNTIKLTLIIDITMSYNLQQIQIIFFL